MGDIEVIDAALFESLEYDDMGLPIGKRFDPKAIPEDIEVVYLYLRVSGKPGSYWLTIDIKGDAEKANLPPMGVSEYITLRGDRDAGITTPFDIGRVPPGHYTVTFSLASSRLAEFKFNIVPKQLSEG